MTLEALSALALKIYGFVKPVITSDLGKEIAGDFKEATQGSMRELWQKIKPWFIVDDKETELLQDVKAAPDDPIAEDAFLAALRQKLNKDETRRQEIESILAGLERSKDPAAQTIVVKNSKNINFGNITGVTGNVHIGDNKNTPPKA